MNPKLPLLVSSIILATSLAAYGEKKTETPKPQEKASPNSEVKKVETDSNDILKGYATQKIAEHTYVIHGPTEMPNPENQGFMNNPGFIVTEKSVIVIDPGSSLQSGQALLTRIKEVSNNPVTHIFATHVHGDHWLANHAFKNNYPDAKFYAHPNMIEKANNGEAERWIETMMTLTNSATKGTKAIIPDQAISHEASLKVDNITVNVHFIAKAHSDTDVMFEVVEDKILFTGDNITNKRLPRMDDGTFKGNIACR